MRAHTPTSQNRDVGHPEFWVSQTWGTRYTLPHLKIEMWGTQLRGEGQNFKEPVLAFARRVN